VTRFRAAELGRDGYTAFPQVAPEDLAAGFHRHAARQDEYFGRGTGSSVRVCEPGTSSTDSCPLLSRRWPSLPRHMCRKLSTNTATAGAHHPQVNRLEPALAERFGGVHRLPRGRIPDNSRVAAVVPRSSCPHMSVPVQLPGSKLWSRSGPSGHGPKFGFLTCTFVEPEVGFEPTT
jgi:hypothetical protein